MKNLRYEKIHNSNTAIIINLHNDYSVKAISGYDMLNEIYTTSLYIKENRSDLWMEINTDEELTFSTNSKNIASAVLSTVSDYFENGFFDQYIDTYEYYLKCFDLGNAQIEMESGRTASV